VHDTVSALQVGLFYHSIVNLDPVPQPMMFVNLEHTTLDSKKSLLLGQISREMLPGHNAIRKNATQLFLVIEQAVDVPAGTLLNASLSGAKIVKGL